MTNKKEKMSVFHEKNVFFIEHAGPPRKRARKCAIGQSLLNLVGDESNFRGGINPYTNYF